MATTKPADHRRILVTGATGNQGGAVVRALSELRSSTDDLEILALTRNTSSKTAQALASKYNVTLTAGDLDNPSSIFDEAGGVGSIWGVFSVQTLDSKTDAHSDDNREYRQGANLIDASIRYGVQHFVQSTVDRGGEISENNPTEVPHFITKHRIEQHLKEKIKTTHMTYTILRPVAFMDLISPGFTCSVFSSLISQLGDKPLQFVATRDIGIFAAQALSQSETDEYKNTAISLAGDELTLSGCNEAFWKALHRPMPIGYSIWGYLIRRVSHEMDSMFQWFADAGYGADISKCRKLNPEMLDLAAYLKHESSFKR